MAQDTPVGVKQALASGQQNSDAKHCLVGMQGWEVVTHSEVIRCYWRCPHYLRTEQILCRPSEHVFYINAMKKYVLVRGNAHQHSVSSWKVVSFETILSAIICQGSRGVTASATICHRSAADADSILDDASGCNGGGGAADDSSKSSGVVTPSCSARDSRCLAKMEPNEFDRCFLRVTPCCCISSCSCCTSSLLIECA